jgi:hypothetical protein
MTSSGTGPNGYGRTKESPSRSRLISLAYRDKRKGEAEEGRIEAEGTGSSIWSTVGDVAGVIGDALPAFF